MKFFINKIILFYFLIIKGEQIITLNDKIN
jgi:hypothetical protein